MKKTKGFSLTEIIITILIIAVLSSIAGPIYNSYSTKSKQSEGLLLLGTIKDAQIKYYNENATFLHCEHSVEKNYNYNVCYNDIFGIDAKANKYYTAFNVCAYNGSHGMAKTAFLARAVGKGPTIQMSYNITTGTTMIYS